MSLGDRLNLNGQADLMRIEAEASAQPRQCHGMLDLTPMSDGERRAWIFPGSRMIFIMAQHLAKRSVEEQIEAVSEMALGQNHQREAARELLKTLLAKAFYRG